MSELSRKRPHTDDGDVTVAKKRVLTGTNGTPQVNGHSDQTEDEQIFQGNLENFRKEAIYRRMKHYHRENERNIVRIQELERRKTTCEAGLAAMTACWSQLLETIRTFVKPDELTDHDIQGKDVFSVVAHIDEESLPELHEALGKTATITEALVHRLIQSGGQEQAPVTKKAYLEELRESQAECAALRSQVDFLKKQLDDCASEKERYHNDLVGVENRFERAQSKTIDLVNPQKHKASSKASTPKEGEATAEDSERKPSSPSQVQSQSPTPGPEAPGPAQSGFVLLPESVKRWEERIAELEAENDLLRKKLWEIPEERMVAPEAMLPPSFDKLAQTNATLQLQLDTTQKDLQEVHQNREQWQQSVLAASAEVIESMRTMMLKRDAENTRLREQRDQHFAELVERRQKDERRWSALAEFKDLTQNQTERIAVLKSELARCKARLAADERQEDLLRFFLQGKPDEAQLIVELRQQKADAEMRTQAAETALSQLAGVEQSLDHEALVKARIDVEEKAIKLLSELEGLKRVFGDDCLATVPPEVAKLNDQIKRQAKELERLNLLKLSLESSEADLFKELEKLGSAWEALGKQVESKVFDLNQMEEKVTRAVVEKARSENKYFATMREKEALEAEKKALVRAQEKSDKAVQDMSARVNEAEKAMRVLREEIHAVTKLKTVALKEKAEVTIFAAGLQASLQTAQNTCHNHMSEYTKARKRIDDDNRILRIKQAEWDTQRRQMEQQIDRLKREATMRQALSRGGSDDEVFQNMRALLYCSVCKDQLRSVIITKCMHTFCKGCIDARIATRQRKCPGCQIPFGQGDVQTYFMQ